MSYTAIKDHIAEIYQLEVSEATISSITDQLIPQLKAWQSRPLDSPHCQNSCHPYLNNLNGGKGDNHGTIQSRTQTSNIKQTAIA